MEKLIAALAAAMSDPALLAQLKTGVGDVKAVVAEIVTVYADIEALAAKHAALKAAHPG